MVDSVNTILVYALQAVLAIGGVVLAFLLVYLFARIATLGVMRSIRRYPRTRKGDF